jgi:hypothetical protein
MQNRTHMLMSHLVREQLLDIYGLETEGKI